MIETIRAITSPLGDLAGYACQIEDESTCLHPTEWRVSGLYPFTSFSVNTGSLVVSVWDRLSKRWQQWIDLSSVPPETWVRFVDEKQRALLGAELRLGRGRIDYRWLGANGELIPPGPLDTPGGPVVDSAAHEATMEGWMTVGGWRRLGDHWVRDDG